MAASTSIVPFQPPTGLPASQALAHAVDHIGRVVKKHESLKRDHEALQQQVKQNESALKTNAKRHYLTVIELLVSSATGAAFGYANGRWGGDKDHATLMGVPVDVGTIFAGHVGGLAVGYLMPDELGQFMAKSLHALGTSSAGIVSYRVGHQKGLEKRTEVTGAGAQANGAKGGTVYAAPNAHK